jgi:predicted MFS family arabinose efflux permease
MSPNPDSPARRWSHAAMLIALTSGFALSQAFRTTPAVMAPQLQAGFGASPQALGVFAGAFHFAFALMQLFVGVGIDLHGIRRTVLAVFPLAVIGAALAASAQSLGALVLGQALIGIGCAPAFLVCTVFVARCWPLSRFAALTGIVMSAGGIGLLATGTPLAWLIDRWSWRAGFAVLSALSVVSWLAIWATVADPEPAAPPERENLGLALRRFGALFMLPHTAGIVVMGATAYASFLTLRGLWLGPMLSERYQMPLVMIGHVALAVSLTSMVGPALFGRLDPGPSRRRRWIVLGNLVSALMMLALASQPGVVVDVALPILFGVGSGYMMLQYADVRAAYPAALIGRALALYTMAMFMGVAVQQAFTGWVASVAPAWGLDPYVAVLLTLAALLMLASLAYTPLPGPPKAEAPPPGA